MSDRPDWEYLYRMDEKRIAALEAVEDGTHALVERIAELEAEVEQYKWQRDECADQLGRRLAIDYKHEATKPFAASDVIVDLNRRWEEHNA